MSDDRLATAEERKWWRRLRETLHAMPSTLEVIMGAQGQLSGAQRGAEMRYFEAHGDADSLPILPDLPTLYSKGLVNNASSL